MMRLLLAVFLLVLCGAEPHSADSPTAHGACELQVAGTEADSAQVAPAATSLGIRLRRHRSASRDPQWPARRHQAHSSTSR